MLTPIAAQPANAVVFGVLMVIAASWLLIRSLQRSRHPDRSAGIAASGALAAGGLGAVGVASMTGLGGVAIVGLWALAVGFAWAVVWHRP